MQGVGTTAVKIEVTLYGPFAIRAAIGCKGTPVGRELHGQGRRNPHLARDQVAKAGFYVFREHLVGSGSRRDDDRARARGSEISLALARRSSPAAAM